MKIHPTWLEDLPPARELLEGAAPLNKDKRLALSGNFVSKPDCKNPPPNGKASLANSLKV